MNMGKPSKQLQDFMAAHKIDHDEVWEVRTGGAWAIKHSALERVAAENKISFDTPLMLEFHAADKIAVICVTGKMGDRTEWSIGEAAPYNNKNTYPFAMAEKRAKDRVALKLLNAHGALYSDAEADEFTQTAPTPTLAKKDAKEAYTKMQREVQECQSREQLVHWMTGNRDRIAILPEDWQGTLRSQCQEMLHDLKNKEAA